MSEPLTREQIEERLWKGNQRDVLICDQVLKMIAEEREACLEILQHTSLCFNGVMADKPARMWATEVITQIKSRSKSPDPIAAAVAEENESCAKAVEGFVLCNVTPSIAAVIRSRRKEPPVY